MPTWEGSITLHKHTTHPRTYKKYLHPSQLALVAILRYRDCIKYQAIKIYKDGIDIERRNGSIQIVRIRLPNLPLDLYNQLMRTKYASSLVALALTKMLDHIGTLPESEQDAYLSELTKEHRSYVSKKPKFPHFSPTKS